MTDSEKRTGFIVNLIAGIAFLALAAALFFFYACGSDESPDIPVTREYTYSDDDPGETVYGAEDYDGLKLYYTAHGKKWHLTRECQYIRSSDSILYTDYETAVSMGLSPCSQCGFPDSLSD